MSRQPPCNTASTRPATAVRRPGRRPRRRSRHRRSVAISSFRRCKKGGKCTQSSFFCTFAPIYGGSHVPTSHKTHPLLALDRAGTPGCYPAAAHHRHDPGRTLAAPQVLRRGAPRPRTRGLRHPVPQPRRAGRRLRPQRRGVPRVRGPRLRIRRGGHGHAAPAAGQPAPAHLPPAQRPRHHPAHGAGQPRTGAHDPTPAPPPRRGHRRLQHRSQHLNAARERPGGLPEALPQPLPVCRLLHREHLLRQRLPRRRQPLARKYPADPRSALRLPPRTEPVPAHHAQGLARHVGRGDRPHQRHPADNAARRHRRHERIAAPRRAADQPRVARQDRQRPHRRGSAHGPHRGDRAPYPHPLGG